MLRSAEEFVLSIRRGTYSYALKMPMAITLHPAPVVMDHAPFCDAAPTSIKNAPGTSVAAPTIRGRDVAPSKSVTEAVATVLLEIISLCR